MKQDDLKKLTAGKLPVLLSTPHPFLGALQLRCDMNQDHIIYEDPLNVSAIRALGGFIICIFCAVELKEECGFFPPVLKQLYDGNVREPELIEPWKSMIERLKK